jgi:hypothetical protein
MDQSISILISSYLDLPEFISDDTIDLNFAEEIMASRALDDLGYSTDERLIPANDNQQIETDCDSELSYDNELLEDGDLSDGQL